MAAPIWTEAELEGALGPEVLAMTDGELRSKLRDIQNETFQMEQEAKRIQANINKKKKDIEDNARKIEMNKQLPYLVGNIVEVIETPEDADEAEDGAFQDRCD
jgi:26S proteasome regulatory subunit T5